MQPRGVFALPYSLADARLFETFRATLSFVPELRILRPAHHDVTRWRTVLAGSSPLSTHLCAARNRKHAEPVARRTRSEAAWHPATTSGIRVGFRLERVKDLPKTLLSTRNTTPNALNHTSKTLEYPTDHLQHPQIQYDADLPTQYRSATPNRPIHTHHVGSGRNRVDPGSSDGSSKTLLTLRI